jgi:hypothetical protein
MMVHDGMALHNVAETVPLNGGLLLQRVPESVRRELEQGARERALQAANTELRFVPIAPVRVTLSAPDGPIQMREYRGDLLTFNRRIVEPTPTTFVVEPDFCQLPAAADLPRLRHAFHPRVVRLAAGGAWPPTRLVLHGFEGARRPPDPDELPMRTKLAETTRP